MESTQPVGGQQAQMDTDALVSSPATRDPRAPFVLRIMTHNIRYAATSRFPNERSWSERLPNLLRQFHHFTRLPFCPSSSLICLQEVLSSQLADLEDALGPAWTSFGVGRDDGKKKGEFNPILYRHSFWETVHSETIWLSPTPTRPGLGWDSGCNRLCSCVVLSARERTGADVRRIMVLNTHLDNRGRTARREGAKMVLQYASKWKKEFQVNHIFLTGDFNSTREETGGAWQVFNESGSGFLDVDSLLVREDPEGRRRFGDKNTFTGFDGKGDSSEVGIIDYIHYGLGHSETLDMLTIHLKSLSVVPNLFDDGIRCSDHRAVVADLILD